MKELKLIKILSVAVSFILIIQGSIMIFAEQSIKISSNKFQSYIISNNKVYSFGNGELGLGENYNNLTVPQEIEELTEKEIVSVSSGLDFSVALSIDRKRYSNASSLV